MKIKQNKKNKGKHIDLIFSKREKIFLHDERRWLAAGEIYPKDLSESICSVALDFKDAERVFWEYRLKNWR